MANVDLAGKVANQAGTPKVSLTVELWESSAWETPGSRTSSTTTNSEGNWAFSSQDPTKTWLVDVIDGTKQFLLDGQNKMQVTDLDVISDIFVSTITEHTAAAGVTIEGVLLKDSYVDLAEATLPASTRVYAGRDNSGDLTLNVLACKTINFAIAGTDEATLSAAAFNLTSGNVFQIAGSQVLSATALASAVKINNANWSGTELTVANGGTGACCLTDGGVLLGSGTGAITALAVLSDGQMIVGDGTGDPVAESGPTLRTSIGVGTGNTLSLTGLTLSGALDANGTIDYDGTDVDMLSSGDIDLVSSNDAAAAIYIAQSTGTSGTIKIHADTGTSVTEGAASIALVSDAGGVELRSTANLANAINITSDGGTTGSITIFNDQGNGTGSICLTSDAGGITLNPGTFVTVGGNATNAGEIRIFEDTDNGCNYVALKAPNVSTSYTMTLPTAVAGTCGFVLTSTTAGVTSWAATGSGSDTTYTTAWVDSSDDAILRLTAGGSGSGDDDLTIVAGSNITLTPSGDNLTIAASSGASQANQAAVEAETNEDTYVPPDLLRHHKGSAKAWVLYESIGSHSIVGGATYNVDSVCDGSAVGVSDIVWGDDFSGAYYAIIGMAQGTNTVGYNAETFGVGGVTIAVTIGGGNTGGVDINTPGVSIVAFGDQ